MAFQTLENFQRMVMAENVVAIPDTCCLNTVAAILDLRLSLLNVVEKSMY